MVTIRARLYTTIVKEMQARLNPHVKAERICHSDGILLGAHQAILNPDTFQVCSGNWLITNHQRLLYSIPCRKLSAPLEMIVVNGTKN